MHDPVATYEAATHALRALEAEAAAIGGRIREATLAGVLPIDLIVRQYGLPTLIADAHVAVTQAAPAYCEHELAALAPELDVATQALVKAVEAIKRAQAQRNEAAAAVRCLQEIRTALVHEQQLAHRALQARAARQAVA